MKASSLCDGCYHNIIMTSCHLCCDGTQMVLMGVLTLALLHAIQADM